MRLAGAARRRRGLVGDPWARATLGFPHVVRMRGLEPPRPYGHTDLNRARLPIPPHPRSAAILAAAQRAAARLAHAGMVAADSARRFGVTASMIVCSDPHRPRAIVLLVLAAGALATAPGARPRRAAMHRHGSTAPALAAQRSSLPAAARTARRRRSRRDSSGRSRTSVPSRTHPLALPHRRSTALAVVAARARRRPGCARFPASPRSTPAPRTASPPSRERRPDRRPPALGAGAVRTPGDGIKIGIIDDGVDQTHPYLRPGRVLDAAGLPEGPDWRTRREGDRRPRVPAAGRDLEERRQARSIPCIRPRDTRRRHRRRQRGDDGDRRARGLRGRAARVHRQLQGADRADGRGVGMDGNAAEIVAAIEAAVADGMNVINLSIGEPEVEPSRDLVALALDAAAAAGVVPVVSAGNDFERVRTRLAQLPGQRGAARSPSRPSRRHGDGAVAELAGFCSAGPTPISLRLKPDVSAPGVVDALVRPGGVGIAVRHEHGRTSRRRGSRAAAQRHPGWTVAQIKAALVATGDPRRRRQPDAPRPRREAAAASSTFRAPTGRSCSHRPRSVSFGLVRPGGRRRRPRRRSPTPAAAPALGRRRRERGRPPGRGARRPADRRRSRRADADGAVAAATQPKATCPGFVVLTRAPRCAASRSGFASPGRGSARARRHRSPAGSYAGNTRGGRASSPSTATPRFPGAARSRPRSPARNRCSGSCSTRPSANFGVVVTHREPGVRVEPRVVAAGDENRLTGYAALPFNLNPYLAQFGQTRCSQPAPCDRSQEPTTSSSTAPTTAGAGRFTFRFWINDMTPPSAKLERARVQRGAPLRHPRTDAGSGVDPATVAVRDRRKRREVATSRAGVVRIETGGLQTRRVTAAPAGVGLPGVAEHGERAADPARTRAS